MSTYKIKLDITVAVKSVSSQYEMLVLYPFLLICMTHFLKVISTITHFLHPADVCVSVVQAILFIWDPEIYCHHHQRQPLDPFLNQLYTLHILKSDFCDIGYVINMYYHK
jgi:hypothetical protein